MQEAAAAALLAAHPAKLGESPLLTAAWIQATRAASLQEVVVLAGTDVEVPVAVAEQDEPAEALLAAHSAKLGLSPLLTAAWMHAIRAVSPQEVTFAEGELEVAVTGHEAAALLAAHSAKFGELPLLTAAWIHALRAASPQEVEVTEAEVDVLVRVQGQSVIVRVSGAFAVYVLLP